METSKRIFVVLSTILILEASAHDSNLNNIGASNTNNLLQTRYTNIGAGSNINQGTIQQSAVKNVGLNTQQPNKFNLNYPQANNGQQNNFNYLQANNGQQNNLNYLQANNGQQNNLNYLQVNNGQQKNFNVNNLQANKAFTSYQPTINLQNPKSTFGINNYNLNNNFINKPLQFDQSNIQNFQNEPIKTFPIPFKLGSQEIKKINLPIPPHLIKNIKYLDPSQGDILEKVYEKVEQAETVIEEALKLSKDIESVPTKNNPTDNNNAAYGTVGSALTHADKELETILEHLPGHGHTPSITTYNPTSSQYGKLPLLSPSYSYPGSSSVPTYFGKPLYGSKQIAPTTISGNTQNAASFSSSTSTSTSTQGGLGAPNYHFNQAATGFSPSTEYQSGLGGPNFSITSYIPNNQGSASSSSATASSTVTNQSGSGVLNNNYNLGTSGITSTTSTASSSSTSNTADKNGFGTPYNGNHVGTSSVSPTASIASSSSSNNVPNQSGFSVPYNGYNQATSGSSSYASTISSSSLNNGHGPTPSPITTYNPTSNQYGKLPQLSPTYSYPVSNSVPTYLANALYGSKQEAPSPTFGNTQNAASFSSSTSTSTNTQDASAGFSPSTAYQSGLGPDFGITPYIPNNQGSASASASATASSTVANQSKFGVPYNEYNPGTFGFSSTNPSNTDYLKGFGTQGITDVSSSALSSALGSTSGGSKGVLPFNYLPSKYDEQPLIEANQPISSSQTHKDGTNYEPYQTGTSITSSTFSGTNQAGNNEFVQKNQNFDSTSTAQSSASATAQSGATNLYNSPNYYNNNPYNNNNAAQSIAQNNPSYNKPISDYSFGLQQYPFNGINNYFGNFGNNTPLTPNDDSGKATAVSSSDADSSSNSGDIYNKDAYNKNPDSDTTATADANSASYSQTGASPDSKNNEPTPRPNDGTQGQSSPNPEATTAVPIPSNYPTNYDSLSNYPANYYGSYPQQLYGENSASYSQTGASPDSNNNEPTSRPNDGTQGQSSPNPEATTAVPIPSNYPTNYDSLSNYPANNYGSYPQQPYGENYPAPISGELSDLGYAAYGYIPSDINTDTQNMYYGNLNSSPYYENNKKSPSDTATASAATSSASSGSSSTTTNTPDTYDGDKQTQAPSSKVNEPTKPTNDQHNNGNGKSQDDNTDSAESSAAAQSETTIHQTGFEHNKNPHGYNHRPSFWNKRRHPKHNPLLSKQNKGQPNQSPDSTTVSPWARDDDSLDNANTTPLSSGYVDSTTQSSVLATHEKTYDTNYNENEDNEGSIADNNNAKTSKKTVYQYETETTTSGTKRGRWPINRHSKNPYHLRPYWRKHRRDQKNKHHTSDTNSNEYGAYEPTTIVPSAQSSNKQAYDRQTHSTLNDFKFPTTSSYGYYSGEEQPMNNDNLYNNGQNEYPYSQDSSANAASSAAATSSSSHANNGPTYGNGQNPYFNDLNIYPDGQQQDASATAASSSTATSQSSHANDGPKYGNGKINPDGNIYPDGRQQDSSVTAATSSSDANNGQNNGNSRNIYSNGQPQDSSTIAASSASATSSTGANNDQNYGNGQNTYPTGINTYPNGQQDTSFNSAMSATPTSSGGNNGQYYGKYQPDLQNDGYYNSNEKFFYDQYPYYNENYGQNGYPGYELQDFFAAAGFSNTGSSATSDTSSASEVTSNSGASSVSDHSSTSGASSTTGASSTSKASSNSGASSTTGATSTSKASSNSGASSTTGATSTSKASSNSGASFTTGATSTSKASSNSGASSTTGATSTSKASSNSGASSTTGATSTSKASSNSGASSTTGTSSTSKASSTSGTSSSTGASSTSKPSSASGLTTSGSVTSGSTFSSGSTAGASSTAIESPASRAVTTILKILDSIEKLLSGQCDGDKTLA